MDNKTITFTTVCMFVVTIMLTPGISYAGFFNSKPAKTVQAKLQTKASAVKSGATATADKLQDKVEDISRKLDAVFSQMEIGRPLLDALEDSNMIDTVKEVMAYVGESQKDYQQFANSGVYVFEREVNDLFYDLEGIVETMQLGDRVKEKINKIRDLLAKMPTQFLYVMQKAVGDGITEIRERTQQVNNNLIFVRDLPPKRAMFANPMSHQDSLCPIVSNRDKKVSYAIIMGKLKELELAAGTINDLSPDDLYVDAGAVVNGGTTVGKFPTKLITILIKHIVGAVKVDLENIKDIAEAVCK